MFEKTLHAGWGDMDYKGHMKNAAFLDKTAATVTRTGGWTDPETRKLKAPPAVLFKVMRSLSPTSGFQVLRDGIR